MKDIHEKAQTKITKCYGELLAMARNAGIVENSQEWDDYWMEVQDSFLTQAKTAEALHTKPIAS